MAAGRVKTPAQAASALDMGLALVAVGQGLVIDPEWVEHARAGRDADVRTTISADDVARTSIPGKLWGVINATPGWFEVVPQIVLLKA
jgi:2,4-dienoyl-CoA reductase (NADPH2)